MSLLTFLQWLLLGIFVPITRSYLLSLLIYGFDPVSWFLLGFYSLLIVWVYAGTFIPMVKTPLLLLFLLFG